jgi:hypothetical protein
MELGDRCVVWGRGGYQMPDQDKPKDYDPTEAADRCRTEAAAWKERNAEAIRSHNERIEREGPILAKYRRF